MAIKVPPTIGAAIALLIQMFVGAAIFSCVTLIAVALHLLLEFVHARHFLPEFAEWGGSALEFLVWAADVLCFALFIIVEAIKFCLRMWEALKD
ncbi:MAG TPA: hypothetical protein VN814_17595 [Caulobacteraceae bacterium]|nr:hypothetical protein [Caulobacteraceae bacterium]